jgi:sulfite reductase (NADPH) flavoprotein alpha-component
MLAPLSSTPFTQTHWQQVQQLLDTLNEGQALWLSGYLAAQPRNAVPATPAIAATQATLLVAHGGETGNGRALAQALVDEARAGGLTIELTDLADLRVRQLNRWSHLLLICSTHGDGDPPAPVQPFFDALMAENAPRLPHLHYAVLALGDSSYEHFCIAGKQLDERLAALGATRLFARQDCDVDFQAPATQWRQSAITALRSTTNTAASAVVATATSVESHIESRTEYSKQNPLLVEVLENVRLTHPHRVDAIHHLELALTQDEFTLEPGDAVGVLPDNPPALVARVLDATGLPADSPVNIAGTSLPLVQALRQHLDLTIPGARFLEFWATASGSETLRQWCAEPATVQRQYLKQVQLLDLISRYPATPAPQDFVEALRPLQPRLYDVANSLRAMPGELHLNVQAWRYSFAERTEAGIASHHLRDLNPGDSVRLYPHRNARFHLPDDHRAPLVLIAAGTGVAPYRAFVQEFSQRQAPPPCWLAFTEHCFEQDFLYQSEWQNAHHKKLLRHVDAVFRAEQPEATLATALLGNAQRLRQWLDEGAHLYFSGDKDTLSACEDALSASLGATDWKTLNQQKRLHRNLY